VVDEACLAWCTHYYINLPSIPMWHRAVVIVWLVLAPATDMAISGALVTFLRTSRTGFAATDDVLTKITRCRYGQSPSSTLNTDVSEVTIQTGLITVIWTVIDLALFLAIDTNLHFIFNIPLAKLYANCMLSSLNARAHWSAQVQSGPQWSVAEQSGVEVTSIREDDMELSQHSVDAPRYITTHSPHKSLGEIKGEVTSTPFRHGQCFNGDSLSLHSDNEIKKGSNWGRAL